MISEELIKRVLNLDEVSMLHLEDNTIYFDKSSEGVNIYELSYRCKEWAFSTYREEVNCLIDEKGWFATSRIYYEKSLDGFYANTEYEATFKVCEWIMNQHESKIPNDLMKSN